MWELHGFKAHHRVVLGCGERLGDGGSTEQGGSAAEENGGGVTPVRVGRGEVVEELRGVEAQLLEWSAWARKLRRDGSMAASSSPAFWVLRRRVLWRGKAEQAKGRME